MSGADNTAPRVPQSTPLVYSPLTGNRYISDSYTAAGHRRDHRMVAWFFNPWTGNARDPRDIDNDPLGYLILPPGEELIAAAPLAATAADLLDRAAGHMRSRAATYDSPQGERSMVTAVAGFNAITGRDLTESEGWLLLTQLKFVRDQSRKHAHVDSLEDAPAYAALYGEARLQGR